MNGGFGWAMARGMPMSVMTIYFLSPAYFAAKRLADARWERLVEAYPDHLEALEVTFGHFLRENLPDVRSNHSKERLSYEADGVRLEMGLNEPVRRPLGWGGVQLRGWRAETPVALPVSDLFLTLARGSHPEWVGRLSGFPVHRLAMVDDAMVTHVCRAVFAPPETPAASG